MHATRPYFSVDYLDYMSRLDNTRYLSVYQTQCRYRSNKHMMEVKNTSQNVSSKPAKA